MNLEYEKRLVPIENNVQDKNSIAWKKLCEYIDHIIKEESDEFAPLEYLGEELFSQIYTLPNSISKLKNVKKIWLYGSKLKRIPPEIGEMQSLEYFDPYTSYNLHWFPYEISNCKNLKDSRISTRALYGNYKYRKPFPDLRKNIVKYDCEILKCSICKNEISYEETNQLWISMRVGTDVLPLLVNSCSKECEEKLQNPAENHIQFVHKGGKHLKQPMDEDERFEIEWEKRQKANDNQEENEESPSKYESPKTNIEIKDLPLLKLIRKIWKK